MSLTQPRQYYWIYSENNDRVTMPWLQISTLDNSYGSNLKLVIANTVYQGATAIGYVDMGFNTDQVLARNEDWLVLTSDIYDFATYNLSLSGVEYITAPLNKTVDLEVISKFGFGTNGSLHSITTGVGNHTIDYDGATRDSTLTMLAGWDSVNLIDHPDIPGTQYWTLIRRDYSELDAYSLFSGYRIRMESGGVSMGNNLGIVNYGEIERIYLANARSGGTRMVDPGNEYPSSDARSLDTNIDLRSYELVSGSVVNKPFSDSFNLAYFNFIRYTSDNIWSGQATIYDSAAGRYSTPGNTSVAGAEVLDVIGTQRNGTHDLVVTEQANLIDGKFRLYAFNLESRVYNVFNDVYLGTAGVDGKSYSTNAATPEGRVALYGFGGKDILTGGAGNDYLFGGEAEYNQLVTGATGNQLTGGPGADYFGVGNTNANGDVDGTVSWAGYNGGQAQIGYAADQIMDWHAGTDTLRVLSNGVGIISGLYGVSGMAGANTIDLRATAAVVTSDQNNSGPRGGTTTGWDSVAGNLDYIYANQATRDAQSIKNEADVTVVNEGLIVARGLEGNDVIYGSPGNDYLYGNQGDNTLDLSNGGTDRAFYDTRSGKQFLGGFASASNDKVYLAKNVIDAFRGGETFTEVWTTYTVDKAVIDTKYSSGWSYTYKNGEGYSQGIDYLYGVTYKAYLSNSFGSQPYSNVESQTMGLAADITTFVAGAVMIGVAVGLCFIPFVGPALAAPLFVAGALLEAGKIYSEVGNKSLGSVEHLNATYYLGGGKNFQSNYAYVLHNDLQYVNINGVTTNPSVPSTTPASGGSANIDNLPFLHFFHGAYTYDGFTPVLELNPGWGYGGDSDNGVHAYFIVYSNTETFVYFVTSQDNLIENGEAFKVAEVNGHLEASDFVVYDSNQDPYNQRADAPVVLKKPTISAVYENSAPTYTASVPNKAYTESPSLRVTGTIASIDPSKTPTTSTKNIVLYDAMQDPDVDGNPIPVATVAISNGDTSFSINDPRSLGQIIIQTDFDTAGSTTGADGSLSQPVKSTGQLRSLELDNTFEYQDRRIGYYTSLLNDVDGDGSMIIEIRSNTWNVIDNGPSNATVNGGNGSDTLLLESTSLHLNRAIDAQIVSIENINVKAPNGPGLSVSVSGGSIADVTVIDPNVMVADGVYTLQFKDADGTYAAPSSAWTITVSNRQVTGYTKGNGGSGFSDTGTYATADWIPLGVNIDVRAQTEGFNINAYNGADTIVGAQGNDNIYGLAGNDTIDGGNGNDTITGGAGLDSLLGGNGADIFVVSAVSDFANGEVIAGGANSAGTVDKLQLSQQAVGGTFGSFTTSASTGTYTAAQLSSQVTGVEVIELTVNASYSLTLSDGIYAGVDANGDGTADNTLTITPTVNITNDVTIVGGAVSGNNELVVQDSGYLDGNDSMVGGAGNDSLQGGDGNDTISGGSNADLIQSGNGNDWIVQTNQQTVLDTITGGAGSDTLTLTNDNAVTDLDHVTQVETIELLSGVGNTFSYTPSNNSAFDADSATGVVIDGDALAANEALRFDAGNLDRAITIWGGAGNDTIIDGAGHDSIVTNDGADTVLLSGGGNDTVQTGVGQDTLTLGNGNDSILMGSQNDVLYGQDRVTVADTLKGGADFDKLVLTNDNATDDLNHVTEFETIELTAGADYVYIIGNNSAFDLDTTPVTVDGSMLGAGDGVNFNATALDRSITIFFGTGNDTIHGGAGDDSLNSGGGNDLFLMEDRMDVDDSLDGGTGNDTLSFTDTTGTAQTNDLNNVINIETITLGDSLTSVTTVDTLVANGATLTINAVGLSGSNTLTWNGTAENDGRFSVLGSAQADSIVGGNQADTLVGGAGVDSLVGQAGDDVFVINSSVVDTTGVGETIAGGAGNDTLIVAAGTQAIHFSDDTLSSIEVLELTKTVTGAADSNAQTLTMTHAQLTGLSTVYAALGDSIILSDAVGSSALTGAVLDGTLTLQLANVGSNLLVLDSSNFDSSTDRLRVAASAVTSAVTVDAALETDGAVSVLTGDGNDLITGTDSAVGDTVSSGNGNDSIVGGAGADSVVAGAGNDTVLMSVLSVDTLDAGADTDWLALGGAAPGTVLIDLSVSAGSDQVLSINGSADSAVQMNFEHLDASLITGAGVKVSTRASATSVIGTAQVDTIIGGAGPDSIDSGGGADVIWAGKGGDKVSAGNGSKVLVVGDLSGASTEKLALINSTITTLTGTNPGLTLAYTTDVAAGETISFDSNANELHVFGAVDLSGVTLTGSYSLVTYSNLTLTKAQLTAATSLKLVDNASGTSTHTLTIKDNNGAALSNDDQSQALESWLDQAGLQLKFDAIKTTPAGLSVGGQTLAYVSTPASPAYVNETIQAPSSSVPAGNPIGASPNSTTLRFDVRSAEPNVGNGDFAEAVTVNSQHFPIYPGDRFRGARFISDFEPGADLMPVPATFLGTGDNRVHNRQFEVYYGSYDQATDTFQVTHTPYGAAQTEYTLILYDNDTSSSVAYVEGLVFANYMVEGQWSLANGGTASATLAFPNGQLAASSAAIGQTYGNSNANTLSASGTQTAYVYALAGNDVLNGSSANDFLSAGVDADTITGGADGDVIDVGDSAFDGTRGDNAQDLVIIQAVAGSSSDSGVVFNTPAVTEMNGASSVAGGGVDETGADYIYNFELQRDVLRIAATEVGNYNHSTSLSTVQQRVNNGFGSTALDQYTLLADLNGAGMGTGDVAVTFRNWQISGSTTFADRVQYVLTGQSGNNNMVGGVLDDTLDGGAGNDTLSGGMGDDSLVGSEGADSLLGGDGQDTLVGGADADSLNGGLGDDTLVVNNDVALGERYDGGGGADVLLIRSDTNLGVVTALDNIDTITLLDNVDVIFSAAALSGDTLAINGTGDNGNESVSVYGSADNDVINLSGISVDSNDMRGLTIDGGAGNDTITGTSGIDTLIGGEGNDVFRFSSSTQTSTSNTPSQMDVISDFNILDDQINLLDMGGGVGTTLTATTVAGGNADDYVVSWMIAGTTNYVLLKGTGVTGGLNFTTTSGGTATATATSPSAITFDVFGVSSTGVTVSGSGPFRAFMTNYTVTNPNRNDNTTYYTKSSNYGASNTHTFDFAVLKASAGSSASNSDVSPTIPHPVTNAVLTIQNTNDGQNNTYPAYVFVGDDTLGAKNDTLTATLSTNPSLMYGFDGNDTITGNTGNDTIFGGNGDDLINGGAGGDFLNGGTGSDRFVYTFSGSNFASDAPAAGADTGYDTLTFDDFGAADKLSLSGYANFTGRNFSGTSAGSIEATLTSNTAIGAQGMLVVTDSAVNTTGDLSNNIASAIDSAFNTSSIGVTDKVFFAVKADDLDANASTHQYWFGMYRKNDTLDGVAGTDVQVLALVSAPVGTGNLDYDNIVVPGQVITGTASAEALNGNVGNDTITGGGGADAIDGWAGADTIVYADKTDAGTWARGDWTPGSFVNCGSIDRITFESSDKIDLSAVIDGTFTFESAYTNIATALSSTQSGDTGYVVGYYDGTFFFDSAGTPNAVFLMFDVGGTDYAVLLTGVTSIAAGNLIL